MNKPLALSETQSSATERLKALLPKEHHQLINNAVIEALDEIHEFERVHFLCSKLMDLFETGQIPSYTFERGVPVATIGGFRFMLESKKVEIILALLGQCPRCGEEVLSSEIQDRESLCRLMTEFKTHSSHKCLSQHSSP